MIKKSTNIKNDDDKCLKFTEIFTVFSEIECMIEFILDHNKIKYNPMSFGDRVEKFKLYLDRRPNKTVNTNDKIFENNTYSLEDLLGKIKKYRNIVAHEAGFLMSGFSELPDAARGLKLKRKYKGSLDELHKKFMQYAMLLYPLFEMTNAIGQKTFEVFDIDGTQIGEC